VSAITTYVLLATADQGSREIGATTLHVATVTNSRTHALLLEMQALRDNRSKEDSRVLDTANFDSDHRTDPNPAKTDFVSSLRSRDWPKEPGISCPPVPEGRITPTGSEVSPGEGDSFDFPIQDSHVRQTLRFPLHLSKDRLDSNQYQASTPIVGNWERIQCITTAKENDTHKIEMHSNLGAWLATFRH
jgi:hypothetical protein